MNPKKKQNKQNNTRKIEAGIFYRTIKIGERLPRGPRADGEDKRSFAISFSSEEPVERFIAGDIGLEVLSHDKGHVDLEWLASGRAPLLLDHNPGAQIGVIEKAEIGADRKGRAVIRFGKTGIADQVFNDVVDGIRSNISVGYRIHNIEHEEAENTPDIFRVTQWSPLEVSVVAIPADQSVGVGRSEADKEAIFIKTKIIGDSTMDPKQENAANTANQTRAADPATQVYTAPTHSQADIERGKDDVRKAERKRVGEITEMANMHNMTDEAKRFIESGQSANEFGRHIADSLYKKQETTTVKAYKEGAEIGLTDKEARDFSFMRAIRAAASNDWSQAPFEKEVSDAAAVQLRRKPTSFFVPLDVLRAPMPNSGRRDLQKSVQTAGGYLVPTELMAGSFIELLRNKMVVRQLGARVLSGLEGDVQIPKLAGGATAYWVGEKGAPDESEQQFAQVSLTPKTVGARTDLTRKLIMQSSPDVEGLVREDLAMVIALELDRVAINGSGVAPEPEGILQSTGIGSVTITGTADWANVVDLETEVATDNADVGALAYLCNAKMRGDLKKTPKEAGEAMYIWQDGSEPGFGLVNGYRAAASNQVPDNKLIFGNFNDQIIGEWGILDVMVNPFALADSGGIRIRLLQDVDAAIRHAESFAVAST